VSCAFTHFSAVCMVSRGVGVSVSECAVVTYVSSTYRIDSMLVNCLMRSPTLKEGVKAIKEAKIKREVAEAAKEQLARDREAVLSAKGLERLEREFERRPPPRRPKPMPKPTFGREVARGAGRGMRGKRGGRGRGGRGGSVRGREGAARGAALGGDRGGRGGTRGGRGWGGRGGVRGRGRGRGGRGGRGRGRGRGSVTAETAGWGEEATTTSSGWGEEVTITPSWDEVATTSADWTGKAASAWEESDTSGWGKVVEEKV
jgi:hypothetical protein